MRVILMRHAQAVAVGEDGVTADFDRHLTAVGRRQASAVAEHLAGLGVSFDAVLCSPFKRAMETAGALLPLLATPGGVTVADEFASESGRIDDMAGVLAATGGETVAAVGHMPDIARLCRRRPRHVRHGPDGVPAVRRWDCRRQGPRRVGVRAERLKVRGEKRRREGGGVFALSHPSARTGGRVRASFSRLAG